MSSINSTLEFKRKELELLRVETSRKEMEFKIEERLDEINRIKEHIEVQLKKENELRTQLTQLKGE